MVEGIAEKVWRLGGSVAVKRARYFSVDSKGAVHEIVSFVPS